MVAWRNFGIRTSLRSLARNGHEGSNPSATTLNTMFAVYVSFYVSPTLLWILGLVFLALLVNAILPGND